MNMSNKIIYGLLFFLTLGLVGLSTYIFLKKENKIAYVRSAVLVEKYHGMLEAREKFNKQKNEMLGRLDTLRLDLERSRNEFLKQAPHFAPTELAQRRGVLERQQTNFVQYSEAIDAKIQEEDQKLTQEVLNQINAFIETYARENDYDLVLGTTNDGSLLFGHEALDITNDLIEKINKHYDGK